MAAGDLRVIETPGFTGLVRLDTVEPADPASDEAAALKAAIAAQAEQALAGDAFTLYTNAMTNAAGIRLDEGMIAAVHAQFP
jgi:peptidyl-prolyl cis-trans isomerase D